MAYLLAVDPGLHLGWAKYRLTPLRFHPPLAFGELQVSRSKSIDWKLSASRVLLDFEALLAKQRDLSVVVEWPFIAPGTEAKGEDVLKIMFMVGWIAAACQRFGCDFHPVPVRSWKGQLSKAMTHQRILSFMDSLAVPWKPPTSGHALDAIGIGAWWLGANFGAGRSQIAEDNTKRRRPR